MADFEKYVPGYSLQDRLSYFLATLSIKLGKVYTLNSSSLPLHIKIELISFLLTKEPFFSLDTLLSKMAKTTIQSTGAQPSTFKDPFQRPLENFYEHIDLLRGPKIIPHKRLVDKYKEELKKFLIRLLTLKQKLEQEAPDQKERRLQSQRDKRNSQKQQIEAGVEQPEVQETLKQERAQHEVVEGSSDTESLESYSSSKEKQSSDPSDQELITSPAVSRNKSKRRHRKSKKSARAASSDQSETVAASAAASSLEPAVFTLPKGMLQLPFYKSGTLQEWNRLFIYLATEKSIDFRGFSLQENRFLQEQGYFENPETVKDNKAKQSRAALYQKLLKRNFTDDEIFLRLSFLHAVPDELTTLLLSMFYERLASDEAVKAKTITINMPIELKFGKNPYQHFNYTLIASFNEYNNYFIFHELLYQADFEKLDIKLESNYFEISPRFEFIIDRVNKRYLLKDRAAEPEIFYRISQDVTKGTIAIEEN